MDNGLPLAAAVALLAAAAGSIRHGSRAKEVPQLYDLDTARWQRPTDAQVADRIVRGGEILGGMSFEHAVLFDPRRVDAGIRTILNRTLGQVFGGGEDDEIQKKVYLTVMKELHKRFGASIPTRAFAEVLIQTMEGTLEPALSSMDRERIVWLAGNLPAVDEALDKAARIARKAEVVAHEYDRREDALAWHDVAAFLGRHKDAFHRYLEPAQRRIRRHPAAQIQN
jgi:hypothetical protein